MELLAFGASAAGFSPHIFETYNVEHVYTYAICNILYIYMRYDIHVLGSCKDTPGLSDFQMAEVWPPTVLS